MASSGCICGACLTIRNGAMRPPSASPSARSLIGIFVGPEGSCGRVMLSWAAAGGVAGGGILVGGLTVAGVVSPGLHLLAAPVLFLLGSILGAVHGGLLAVAGRPGGLSRTSALTRAAIAGLIAVPLLGITWIITTSIALSAALVTEWRISWAIIAAAGWLMGLVLCGWAAVEGWHAARRALSRWPAGRVGSVIAAVLLAPVAALSVRVRPQIWGTELRLNGVGAVALAFALMLWVGFPVICTILHLAQGRLTPHHSGGGEAGMT